MPQWLNQASKANNWFHFEQIQYLIKSRIPMQVIYFSNAKMISALPMGYGVLGLRICLQLL
jgi:hypothetical protein